MWKLSEDNIHYVNEKLNLSYPRTSAILEDNSLVDFSMVDPEVLEAACAYGTAAHYATELWDRNILDINTLDENLHLDLEAWIKFKKENDVEILETEVTYASNRYRYACTLDRVAMFRGVKAVIDLKTATMFHRTAALQVASNQEAYNEHHSFDDRIKKRVVVRLNQTGDYSLPKDNFYSRNDIKVFVAAKTMYDYRRSA